MPAVVGLMLYAVSAMVATIVIIATLKVARRSWFRTGLLVYLIGTLWWSLIDLLRWSLPHPDLLVIEAWTMPATALVVAGVRLGVFAATKPANRTTALDAVVFSVHPALTVVAASIPALHPLIAVKGTSGVSYGPLFWGHLAISYALMVAATVDLIRGRSTSRILTKRAAPIVISLWAAPIVASVVTVLSEGPDGIDLMPVGFALTSLLLWRSVVPADVRGSMPIARSQVFDVVSDAVLVIDESSVIVDANPAALSLAGATQPLRFYQGQSMWRVWPELANATQHSGEFDVHLGGTQKVLDVSIAMLRDELGRTKGRAVVMRDVTAAVHQRRELARLRVELSELVIKDAVTGLHNRRYAEEHLPKTLARCRAKGAPLSIAIVDVDHFKTVNDTFGHSVGDRVLQVLARVMRSEVPASMIARIGGEEFLIMLPGLTSQQAYAHAEKLRAACGAAEVAAREGTLRVTVSAGVATLDGQDGTVQELIEAADDALYRAKRAGRNRTCIAESDASDDSPSVTSHGGEQRRKKRSSNAPHPLVITPSQAAVDQVERFAS